MVHEPAAATPPLPAVLLSVPVPLPAVHAAPAALPLQYLLEGGCAYKDAVTAVYIFNLPSWDVQVRIF